MSKNDGLCSGSVLTLAPNAGDSRFGLTEALRELGVDVQLIKSKGAKAVVALRLAHKLRKKAIERRLEGARRGGRGNVMGRSIERTEPNRATDQAAEILGVSGRLVRDARWVELRAPELLDSVVRGQVSIPTAKKLAVLEKGERERQLAAAPNKQRAGREPDPQGAAAEAMKLASALRNCLGRRSVVVGEAEAKKLMTALDELVTTINATKRDLVVRPETQRTKPKSVRPEMTPEERLGFREELHRKVTARRKQFRSQTAYLADGRDRVQAPDPDVKKPRRRVPRRSGPRRLPKRS